MADAKFYYVEPGRWPRTIDTGGRKPFRVWTLIGGAYQHDKSWRPPEGFEPVHFKNAWLEDEGHDWSWRGDKVNYKGHALTGEAVGAWGRGYGPYMTQGNWVFVQFADPEATEPIASW